MGEQFTDLVPCELSGNVALLSPRVGHVMVARLRFPVTQAILRQQLNPLEPFDALVKIAPRNHAPYGSAMNGLQLSAIVSQRQQCFELQGVGQRQRGAVISLTAGNEGDELRFGQRATDVKEML